jgi:hypothetical protein
MLDDQCMTESMKGNTVPLWNEKQNKAAWKLYLADCGGDIPKYAAPGRETDYSRLPPAVTYVGALRPSGMKPSNTQKTSEKPESLSPSESSPALIIARR